MAIRVNCPSCGRSGRLPDHAVGRTVQCPACSHRYRLTPDQALPEGLELVDDEPAAAPPRPAASSPRVRPPAEPAPSPRKRRPAPDDDPYAVDSEGYVEPPSWAVKPTSAYANDAGGGVPLSVLIGGSAGGALVLILAAVGTFSLFRGSPTPRAPRPAPAAAPALRVMAPVAAVAAPVAAEPAGESDVAAAARAGVSQVAAQDDGGGRTLSTADIVSESEPSVALVKGSNSSGTGFLVAPGLLATNAHVIGGEYVANLEVRFVSADAAHKAPLRPELLYEDRDRDLAFLAVKTDLRPLRVARSYRFRKGEDVTVIGSPGVGEGQVLENAISRGVMSTRTSIDGHDFYQLSIAINPGNSGGPVFDSAGRVIGVATLKSSKQEAMGFCIPVEDLHKALDALSRQSGSDAEQTRARHRLVETVEDLGAGGALYCLVTDLRRISAASPDADVSEALRKLESVIKDFDAQALPEVDRQSALLRSDRAVPDWQRTKVGEMADNFRKIRQAYGNPQGVREGDLRTMKQAHRRLINELYAALSMEVPQKMMVAFDDHAAAQSRIVVSQAGSPLAGSLGQRMLERRRSLMTPGFPGAPGFGPPNIPRPPGFGPPNFPSPSLPRMPGVPRGLGPRMGLP